MKKFIVIVSMILVLAFIADTAYYRWGWYVDFHEDQEVTTFMKTEGDKILMNRGFGYEPFEIRGVNMGSGIPGEWSTDFAVDYDTYYKWFGQIQEMGANTLRIYTVQDDTFYNAFYDYNHDNPDPLWLIHGVWVNDYVQNSHRDAFDEDFFDTFLDNCITMVDVIHGQKKLSLGRMASAGHGSYRKDVSQWVIGYILGVEWEDITVAYTNDKYRGVEGYSSYQGRFMYSGDDARPFEVMLTHVGDKVIEYESKRYKEQRLIAFSNWPTTDPLTYPDWVVEHFMKCARVDVENILCTDQFISGQFASYHVYPYYPDYISYTENFSLIGIDNPEEFRMSDGKINTYKAYLSLLTDYHTMPVVIAEFGVSTGRGIAQVDFNTGRNQGNMSEKDQGRALVECYDDIKSTDCAGCIVFTWQDEWFKRTWNTMYAINMKRNPYWSDYQTNEQYFGLLSFDPGKERCVSYVDGDLEEWTDKDIVWQEGKNTLSFKYDEKFVYFLMHKDGFDLNNDKVYIPLDITPKTGSSFCVNYDLLFDRAADFIIIIDGKNNSKIQVQERYESLRSNYAQEVYNFDTYEQGFIPDIDSPKFTDIDMVLRAESYVDHSDVSVKEAELIKKFEVFETGKLKYGNANPDSPDFDSLADFMDHGEYVEIKLPWQLLNFADPSRMTIHDDYYDGNYGVEYINIDSIYAGIATGDGEKRVHMEKIPMKGWGNKVTYHERLKSSYYVMQDLWRNEN